MRRRWTLCPRLWDPWGGEPAPWKGCRAGGEQGFTLIEILVSIIALGIMTAASVWLVTRLTAPVRTTVRYELQSLAANSAADTVWGIFRANKEAAPGECLPWSDGLPPETEFRYLERIRDSQYYYAFRCLLYKEDENTGDQLYRVRVWLLRKEAGADAEPFPAEELENPFVFEMLALVGGYAADD